MGKKQQKSTPLNSHDTWLQEKIFLFLFFLLTIGLNGTYIYNIKGSFNELKQSLFAKIDKSLFYASLAFPVLFSIIFILLTSFIPKIVIPLFTGVANITNLAFFAYLLFEKRYLSACSVLAFLIAFDLLLYFQLLKNYQTSSQFLVAASRSVQRNGLLILIYQFITFAISISGFVLHLLGTTISFKKMMSRANLYIFLIQIFWIEGVNYYLGRLLVSSLLYSKLKYGSTSMLSALACAVKSFASVSYMACNIVFLKIIQLFIRLDLIILIDTFVTSIFRNLECCGACLFFGLVSHIYGDLVFKLNDYSLSNMAKENESFSNSNIASESISTLIDSKYNKFAFQLSRLKTLLCASSFLMLVPNEIYFYLKSSTSLSDSNLSKYTLFILIYLAFSTIIRTVSFIKSICLSSIYYYEDLPKDTSNHDPEMVELFSELHNEIQIEEVK